MKKIISVVLSLVLCVSLCTAAFAEGDAAAAASPSLNVYVTISSAGTLSVVQVPVAVTDKDGDGTISVNDALIAAHEEYYGGGADGYVTYTSSYGLAISRLWGIENGGSYMYYVNDQYSTSLTSQINDGDYITAYSFQDLTNWSDLYSFFDLRTASVQVNSPLTLSLFSFDWNLSTTDATPVASANILIDGKMTSFITDSDGKVTLNFDTLGTHIVSAVSSTSVLTPPVCKVTVGFADVSSSSWYYQAVSHCYSQGWITGDSATTFSPDKNMSLDEYMTLVYRYGTALGLFDGSLATQGDDWTAGAEFVNTKLSLGFASLDSTMTRGELAKIAAAFFRLNGVKNGSSVTAFTDSATSEYGSDIEYLHSLGAVSGYEDGGFHPGDSIKRSEVAQVIYNIDIGNICMSSAGDTQ